VVLSREERPDQRQNQKDQISAHALFHTIDAGQPARLGGKAEHAPPIELEPPVLRLAAHITDIDLLDDDRELERGENLVPADRADIEADARGVARYRLRPAGETLAPTWHRRDLPPFLRVARFDP